jgi:3-oxoadipate enol-lactonase
MTQTAELEQATLARDGFSLHYVAQGDPRNDLIVFLHPAFGDHRCFGRQLDVFAQDYRVVAVDMPGHGRSQLGQARASIADTGQFVAEIIAREGHAAAHIVGVSLGSLIAQDTAARFPDAVTSLTVVGGYPIFGPNKAIQRAQAREMVKWLAMIMVSMPRFRRYLARTSAVDPQARAVFERSAQLFTRRSFRAMAGLNAIMRPEYQPQRHPLQILVGEHDLPLVRAIAEPWHRREAGSAYHVIGGAGHCANMDNAPEFNARLRAFIDRQATRPAA